MKFHLPKIARKAALRKRELYVTVFSISLKYFLKNFVLFGYFVTFIWNKSQFT